MIFLGTGTDITDPTTRLQHIDAAEDRAEQAALEVGREAS